MKVLFLTAEVAPYVSVGGLSQVMYFLPRSLTKRGHQVRLFTAKYGAMSPEASGQGAWNLALEMKGLRVPVLHDNGPRRAGAERAAVDSLRDESAMTYGGATKSGSAADGGVSAPSFDGYIDCDILSTRQKPTEPLVYFVQNKEYFEMRANVFGYTDDYTRFALLSKACLEWLLQQHERRERGESGVWWPDVVHCHDWHASYFIDLARRDKRYRKVLASLPIVLTVHNFRYQGAADFQHLPESEHDTGTTPLAPLISKRLQKQNILKRGLLLADAVTTVSPTHAIEVMTSEYAEGLASTLKSIRGKFSGILNGLDTKEFDPATDSRIHQRYSRRWFRNARQENKRDLQRTFSLPQDPSSPMFAFVGRLAPQKGLDILIQALTPLLEERPEVQFVVLGTGNEGYQDAFKNLKHRFPKQVGIHLKADFHLPRNIFSAADVMLIPSLFEPGGIVALEALRYGAVPLVRRTGGLNDSVTDFDPATGKGNGFSFASKNAWALYGAMIEALTLYHQPRLWERVVANAMADDFSWDHAAKEYEAWYAQVIQRVARA